MHRTHKQPCLLVGGQSSITFQRELIYSWWETVQATSLLFCKLHTEEFMGLSNKYSLWAAPERTRVITLRKVQPEMAGRSLEGVPEAWGQGNSGCSAPLFLPRASQGSAVLLGILLGSGNSDPGRGPGPPSNCLGTARLWHSWRSDKKLLCFVWDKSEGERGGSTSAGKKTLEV